MDEKSRKTALKVTGIVTLCCLIAALGIGVVSRFINVSDIFYYILAYIALISMLTDSCIKKGIVRFVMVLIYGVCILAITVLIFFRR